MGRGHVGEGLREGREGEGAEEADCCWVGGVGLVFVVVVIIVNGFLGQIELGIECI